MPYKNKNKQKEYMKEYMRRYRKSKKTLLIDVDKLKELKKRFPSAYDLLMSKKKK